MNNSILDLVKKAHDAEELVSLAKEAGLDLNLEEAKQYFAKADQEVSAEDLEQVAGGAGQNDELDFSIVARF